MTVFTFHCVGKPLQEDNEMPVYRGPDGEIIEDRTDKSEDDTRRTDRAQSSSPPEPDGGQAGGAERLDAPTRKMNANQVPSGADSEEKTRVVGRRPGRKEKSDSQDRKEEAGAMEDPISGWLVVVGGPGKGRALTLGYGANSIGRGDTNRVRLDFGDDQVSRGTHATVTYDPRGKRFYVQHGGGTNLTYLDDEPVLTPTDLPALNHISLGDTVLRFVPLCGDEFDWQEWA